jgi:Cys/Met metabolism PLP-dependent enzyme
LLDRWLYHIYCPDLGAICCQMLPGSAHIGVLAATLVDVESGIHRKENHVGQQHGRHSRRSRRPAQQGCGPAHLPDGRSASLGGVESLAVHPASMWRGMLSDDQIAASGVPLGLVRFAAGIEDTADLVADALAADAVIDATVATCRWTT